MAKHTIKEKSIESFLNDKIGNSNVSFGYITINDGCGSAKVKLSNRHLHEKLTEEIYLKKNVNILPGDEIRFELTDTLEGSEQVRGAVYNYSVEDYDAYAILLKRQEIIID